MREITVDGETKIQGIVSLVVNYRSRMVELVTAYGIADGDNFRADMSTIQVKELMFDELMKSNGQGKPKNEFRQSDLFAMLDGGHVKKRV